MDTIGTHTYAFIQAFAITTATRLQTSRQGERGEGVISAALAVLIMAFLAAAMWVAYKGLFEKAATASDAQIDKIGQ